MIDFSLLPMTTIDLDRLTLLTHGYSFLTGGRPPLEGHEEVSAAMRRLNRLRFVLKGLRNKIPVEHFSGNTFLLARTIRVLILDKIEQASKEPRPRQKRLLKGNLNILKLYSKFYLGTVYCSMMESSF